MFQELIVFAIITSAVLFLGRHILRSIRGNKSCGSCPATNGGCAVPAEDLPNGGLPFEV